MTEIMMGIYTEPDTVRLLLEKCTAFIMEYCKALKACGTDGVIIAEPAAGLLAGSAIKVSYGQIVHHIENRSRTDWCSLEKLLYRESSIEKIFTVISDFVANL